MLFSQFIRELQCVSDLKCAITKLVVIINNSQGLYAGWQKEICPPGVFTIDFGFSVLYYFTKKFLLFPLASTPLKLPFYVSLLMCLVQQRQMSYIHFYFFSKKIERFMENKKTFWGKIYRLVHLSFLSILAKSKYF